VYVKCREENSGIEGEGSPKFGNVRRKETKENARIITASLI